MKEQFSSISPDKKGESKKLIDNGNEKKRSPVESLFEEIKSYKKHIDISSFIGTPGISEKEIRRDMQEVERLKVEFEKSRKNESLEKFESSNLADISETILPAGINEHNWFGGNMRAMRTSEFDDFKNKIDNIIHLFPDEIVESADGLRLMGLSIDMTSGKNMTEDKFKKINELKEKLLDGDRSEIKYLKTIILTENGPQVIKKVRIKIPKIILGVSPEMIMQADIDFSASEKDPNNKVLKIKAENTPVKKIFIKETILQLKGYILILNMGRTNEKLTDFQKKMRKEITSMYQNVLDDFEKAVADSNI